MKIEPIPRFLDTLIALWRAYPFPWWRKMLLSRDFWAGAVYFLPLGIRKADVVVDVGADIGDWSAISLAFLRPNRLVAIEPLPSLQSVLHSRLGALQT